MTEATSTLWVEMKMRDLVTKPSKKINRALSGIGKVGQKAFKAMGRNVKDFATSGLRQITRFTSGATRKIKALAKLGLVGFGVAAAGFGVSFLKSAIEFEESASKFQAVFKGAAESAAEDVRRINQETGASIVELTRYFGNLQDTFVPMGLAVDEAAKLSAALVELGIDVASFQNKSTDDVLRDFQSALVGNTETVRKYGIVITQATLKQEAYRLGLTKGNQELTEQAKLQARLSLLFAGTVDAQGDAIRTLDSTANVFRRLRSNYEELKVSLGGEIASRILKIIEAMGGVEGVTRRLALAMATLTGAVNVTLGAIRSMAEASGGLFGRLERTDGIVSLLSGRFSRLREEAIKTAQQTEADFAKLGGVLPEGRIGLADQVAAEFDSIPSDLFDKFKQRLRRFFLQLGSLAESGAEVIGNSFIRGILRVMDGFEIPNPFGDSIVLDFTNEIAKSTKGIEAAGDRFGFVLKSMGRNYDRFTGDLQIASDRVTALIGDSNAELLEALTPDTGNAASVTETYRRTGKEWGIALGQSFREGASAYFDEIVPPGTRAKLASNLQELTDVSIAAARVAQQAALAVVQTPQSFLAYVAVGIKQFSSIEEGIIAQMSASTLPSRLDQFFANQNARIAREVGKEVVQGGGELSTAAGFDQYLSKVREAREAFFNAGTTAGTVFAQGVRDAGDAMGTFAQQSADAATGLVFGLQSSLSTGFETFITSAGDAGDAWDAFRDRFRGTLAQIASDLIASNLTKKITALFGGGAGKKDDSGAAAAAAATAAAATAVSAQASAAISAGQATLAASAAAAAAALAAKIAASAAFSSIGGKSVAGMGGVLNSTVGTGVQYESYGTGGVTNGPTQALFGERQKEAFVPLPNNGHIPVEIKGGSGGGGDVNISIPVNALDPSTAADVIRSQMHLIAGDIAAMIQGNGHRELRVAVMEAR